MIKSQSLTSLSALAINPLTVLNASLSTSGLDYILGFSGSSTQPRCSILRLFGRLANDDVCPDHHLTNFVGNVSTGDLKGAAGRPTLGRV